MSRSSPSADLVLPALLRSQAESRGEQDLIVLGRDRLSYADAEARSAALAVGLLEAGASTGTHIALLAPNGAAWVVAWLAAARIGAVVVPLSTYAPPRELGRLIHHSDVEMLIAVPSPHVSHWADQLEAALPGLALQPAPDLQLEGHPTLRGIWLLDEEPRPWSRGRHELVPSDLRTSGSRLSTAEAAIQPADRLTVIYSSGSTGEPKGAVHSHGGLLGHAAALAELRGGSASDRIYSPMPFFWVGGVTVVLLRALVTGGAVVLEERFEPTSTLALLEQERVTHVLGWPHMTAALESHPDAVTRDLSSLRGGTALGLLPRGLRPADPSRVPSALGMTETGGPHLAAPDLEVVDAAHRGSFGRTVPGFEHMVTGEGGAPVAPGEVGELWVRGPYMMLGLHGRPASETFTAEGWYPTGDLGAFDAGGHFHFAGRKDFVIKTAGTNVDPSTVEAALLAHESVSLAVVVGIPAGERGSDVAALLVSVAELDLDVLRRDLRDLLPSYAVPREIRVVASEDEIPWLASGKVDRRAVMNVFDETR